MDPPVRRCPGCHLKVHTPVEMADGRNYCETCAEQLNLAPEAEDASNLEWETWMPDEQTTATGAEANREALAGMPVEPLAPSSTSSPASPRPAASPQLPPANNLRVVPGAPQPSTPTSSAAPTSAASMSGEVLTQTLESLLQREQERLHDRRSEVEARIRRSESELDAIAERLEHIDGLLADGDTGAAQAI